MDENLKTKLELVEKPFHEKTIAVDDWIPIAPLYEIVRVIFKHIQQYYPTNNLYAFDDWHFHDSFISHSKKISYKRILGILESEDTFYRSRHRDYEVYKAYYPDSFDYLLRYYILDEDDDPKFYPGKWGAFSFTGYGNDLYEISKCMSAFKELPIIEINSNEYFNNNYGG